VPRLDPGGPVGLAAGFDRDGSRLDAAARCGFAFVELGTVTPAPVPGHNPGAAALAGRLARREPGRVVVGVNLGMQPGSPPHAAWRDYAQTMRALWGGADFLVLNFTADAARALRGPCHRHLLCALLVRVRRVQESLARSSGRSVPVLVKWPVGPRWLDAVRIASQVRVLGYAGMVAAFETEPAAVRAWEAWVPRACAALARVLRAPATLVAVGGVDSAARALALRAAGAGLVEVYRGFVVQGASLVHGIARAWPRQPEPLTPAPRECGRG
jgi:dihydroorotate dehydrogenase